MFDAIRALMEEPEKPRRKKIGFEVKEPKAKYMKKLCVVDIRDVPHLLNHMGKFMSR